MKLTSILIILLFAFTLAACGGGGSSGPAPDNTTGDGNGDGDGTAMMCPAGQVGEYPDCMDPGPTAEEIAAEKARIEGMTAAIADPDGDGEPGVPGTHSELTYKRPGEEVSFATGGKTTVGMSSAADELGKNDVNIKNANEFQAVSESRVDLEDFDVSVHERTTAKGYVDTLTVYTNMEAAKAVLFDSVYSSANDSANGVRTDDAVEAEPGETTYRTITFGSTDITAKGTRAITGSGFPSGASGDDTVERMLEAESKFSGTFRGVPGSYACGNAECTIEQSVAGGVQVTAGTLTFTPTKTVNDTQDAHAIAGADPDTDFISFGYWMQDTGSKYGVSTFSGGSMPYGGASLIGTELNALQGTATYEGSATGLYARKDLAVVEGKVVGTPAEAGQFSADVELTAHFNNVANPAVNGSNEISAKEAFSISGMVDNFQSADGKISDWSLMLNSTSLRQGDSDAYTGEFTGMTGAGNMQGEWKGALFGESDAGQTADTDDTAATVYPSSVTGEFTGHFEDGHVIGAFGATR